eukprot:CAMPEP_0114558990 /NCGR_PEP_ID=MMETSP0114-20121206/10686_1 /TAXON_ID=31324 /ORGANISM="Goniomonas sp, Strain m" /LENGTH=179 /DNA_ID=CAMNT_0001744437 /DNA_START=50 /DNA_END=589 /DNA_ORIENTATION=-
MSFMPEVHVLLIGQCDNMPTFAEYLIKSASGLKLNVRSAESLPLPPDPERPPIDFCVFVMDMMSRHSVISLRDSLNCLDVSFFLGKCAVICVGAGVPGKYAVSQTDLEGLLSGYEMTSWYSTSLCDPGEMARLAQNVVRSLRVVCCSPAGITPMFMRTADLVVVAPTTGTAGQEAEESG